MNHQLYSYLTIKSSRIIMSSRTAKRKPATVAVAIGPFKAIGMLLGTIAPVASAIHRGATGIESFVDNSFNLVDDGFEAIDLLVDNALLDFANDNIVQDAKRKVATATAQAEAKAIIASLTPAT